MTFWSMVPGVEDLRQRHPTNNTARTYIVRRSEKPHLVRTVCTVRTVAKSSPFFLPALRLDDHQEHHIQNDSIGNYIS